MQVRDGLVVAASAVPPTGGTLDGAYVWLVDDVLTSGATAGAQDYLVALDLPGNITFGDDSGGDRRQ